MFVNLSKKYSEIEKIEKKEKIRNKLTGIAKCKS